MAPTSDPALLNLFWDSLAESGAISTELMAELRESWTPESWRPIGEVLIRSGTLTLRQVAGLIGMQASEPHMRIGDLAIREGLCSKDQVVEALKLQREACPGPIEILMRDGRVEGEELLDALLKYAHYLEGRVLHKQNHESHPDSVTQAD